MYDNGASNCTALPCMLVVFVLSHWPLFLLEIGLIDSDRRMNWSCP